MYFKNFSIISMVILLVFLTTASAVADVTVTNIETASGKEYKLADNGLQLNEKYYIDRDYVVLEAPDELIGIPLIMTGNDDKKSTGAEFLCFEIDMPATIWIGHDSRGEAEKGGTPPNWLASEFKQHTDMTIKVTDANMDTFVLWEKSFPAGKVCIAGNAEEGAAGQGSNYIVLVEASSPETPVKPLSKLGVTWGMVKNMK